MEQWVPLTTEHAISDNGRIYSFPRPGSAGGYLKYGKDKDGYYKVGIRLNGSQKWHRVHNLVCRAFHGPPPSERHVTDHVNHVVTDNRAGNLRWLDFKENSKRQSQNKGNRKLTAEQVVGIRRDREKYGWGYGKLAQVYGTKRITVRDVVKRRTWAHLP